MQHLRMITTASDIKANALMTDIIQLSKLRLSILVVFSAATGYWTGNGNNWQVLICLLTGGFLVTAAANAINQIIEVRTDSLMQRTALRPLPTGRLQLTDAIWFAILSGILGFVLLLLGVNALAAILSISSLIIYSFFYTPLKQVTPFAVWIGAIPGAMPPLIGWVSATNALAAGGMSLFMLQFTWQFPHFWSIAWVSAQDYARAGFYLLPLRTGANRKSAYIIALITLLLVPAAWLPWWVGISGVYSAILVAILGLIFFLLTLRLISKLDRKSALLIMFASFIYLPIAQIAFWIDRVI